MPGAILLCVDGSDLAQDAARAGLALLRPGTDVRLVTVVEPPDSTLVDGVGGFASGGMTAEEFDRHDRGLVEGGESLVREASLALELEPSVGTVLRGDAGPTLCDFAREIEAAVIVVGTRGRSGLKRALLGSVSDYVVRNAPCAVLAVGGSA
jgi:nucleotide-binding universal stress UspA family protein